MLFLVGVVASVAIVAAIVNGDSPSSAQAIVSTSTTDASLCDANELELSVRASGFAGHVAALRLSGTEPCDVGELNVTAAVIDRDGKSVATTVPPPHEFSGQIDPGEELIASFDYSARCRQKGAVPFSATVIAAGEIGSLRATAPVAFRRDPFTTSPC